MKRHTFIVWVSIFVLGCGAGGAAVSLLSSDGGAIPKINIDNDIRDRFSDNRFTSPLLECSELPESISIGERLDLEKEIEGKIASAKSKGVLTEASVYFRDLNNGPWFGINESFEFYPASLLKVPLAMYYYWQADTDPGILSQEIEITAPIGSSIVHFPARKELAVGTIYSIEDLIRLMLQESNNDAAHILSQYAGSEKTARVYKDLGIPTGMAENYSIDVHTYASFFRVLYNATYIGRSRSEHMLSTLSDSSFAQGLKAGVPSNVSVAHKFGEKVLDAESRSYQLHDCGIVYAGETPYTLCVMTQGRDFDELAGFIQDVSALVYEEVTR
ncbi:MAG: serine hydrolase [Minisyncoccia bacterium]